MVLPSLTYAQAPHLGWFFLVAVGIAFVVAYAMRIHNLLGHLCSPAHQTRMLPGFSWPKIGCRLVLFVASLGLLFLALLRPQYQLTSPTKEHEYSRDLIIAVDVSRSMAVQDCDGKSRIESVRQKIYEFLGSLKSERVALIIFAGNGLVQCPFTKDFEAFSMFVDLLEPGIFSGSGTTSLSAALHSAASLYETDNNERKHKLLVILTDGEDFSVDLEPAQKLVEKIGLQVSVISVGSTDGGPIPCFSQDGKQTGYQRDQAGAVVISRPNEPLLRSLTQRFGGLFCRGTNDHSAEISKILEWVRAREAERCAGLAHGDRGDIFMWLIGLAWCFLGIAWFL